MSLDWFINKPEDYRAGKLTPLLSEHFLFFFFNAFKKIFGLIS